MPRKPILVEPISYEDAGKFLENIEDNDLLKEFETHIGGTFKAKKLKEFVDQIENGFSGLLFWFCLEKGSLYLVCEPKFNFEYPKHDVSFSENLRPGQDNLIKPGKEPFGLNLRDFRNQENPPRHEDLIRGHRLPNHLFDKKIPKLEVIDYKTLFEVNPIFKNHQKYGHAYFGNEEGYVTNFFGIDGIKNVRYYFGYDKEYYPNYIRVILVPVDAQGKNISKKKKGAAGELLQKSVPPPPNN